jgi:tetratricopeptide (TPR) repeat protein
MRIHILIGTFLLLTQIAFTQQKLLIEKDSVSLYAVFTLKESAICNCSCPTKDKKIYHYAVTGKIVNKSSKQISSLNVEIKDKESDILLNTCKVKNAVSDATIRFNGNISIPSKLSYTLKEACCDWSTGLPNVKCAMEVKFEEPKQTQASISAVEPQKNTLPKEDKLKMQAETKVTIVQPEIKPVPLVKEEKVVAVPIKEERVVEKPIAEKPKAAQTASNPNKTEKNKERLSKVADVLVSTESSSSERLAKTSKNAQNPKTKPVGKRTTIQICATKEREVYLYLLLTMKSIEICNCSCPMKGQSLYEYEIYGKIVNKSNKNIKVENAAFFIKDYYETCKKVGKGIGDVGNIIVLPEYPIYIKARSEKFVDYETTIKLDLPPSKAAGRLMFKDDTQHQFDPIAEKEENNFILSGLDLYECGQHILSPAKSVYDTTFTADLLALNKIAQSCPENFSVYRNLADIYFKAKEEADANWLKLAIMNYEQSIYFLKTDLNEPYKTMELWLLEAYWKLANLYEYAGMYEQAIPYYNLLKKYSPEYIKQREKEIMAQYKTVTPAYTTLNYPEEATAHIILCRYLLKNRPAISETVVLKDTTVTTAMVERMDFSDKTIQQRSGLEPVKDLVKEVEKQQQYKTKDPSVKGKIIDVALLALSWAVAPKGMKVEERNRFIMGTLSTLVSLIDKDKINATGTSTMLSDLAGLQSSPVAKNAEAAFNKVEPPLAKPNPVAPSEPKKIETAGGVTISDKWEIQDISGEYKAVNSEGTTNWTAERGESGTVIWNHRDLINNQYTTNLWFFNQKGKNITHILKYITKVNGMSSEGGESYSGEINGNQFNLKYNNDNHSTIVKIDKTIVGDMNCIIGEDGVITCNINDVVTLNTGSVSKTVGKVVFKKIK